MDNRYDKQNKKKQNHQETKVCASNTAFNIRDEKGNGNGRCTQGNKLYREYLHSIEGADLTTPDPTT